VSDFGINSPRSCTLPAFYPSFAAPTDEISAPRPFPLYDAHARSGLVAAGDTTSIESPRIRSSASPFDALRVFLVIPAVFHLIADFTE